MGDQSARGSDHASPDEASPGLSSARCPVPAFTIRPTITPWGTMNNTPHKPAAPPPGPLAKPKKSRTNMIIIGAAAAVIAAIVATGIVVVQTRDNGGDPNNEPPRSAPADKTLTTEEEPEPTAEESEPGVRELQDTAAYDNGVEVTLSDYQRGTSTANAAPANTPYVSFAVTISNKSESALDVGTGTFTCYYGDASQESRQIFDFDEGLRGLPSVRLRPGRTAKATVACEMAKDERYLQVELTPSINLPKTIFAGDVK
ncbi:MULTISPECIES: hypothetical protein [unclassified Streptomyces]|uniref:hypothetical protein n=1 Tax=unclassified Streptomyces TaxID=2593676 RepID=UPI001661EA0A|nr:MULTISPECIES: hypothetical protein [unclassified Streptomyces]MBD0843019.1 hypothetical protein [Streptomyces sp. TRM68416]